MSMAEGRKREMVVLYPSPGMGHLVSMVELGKLFVCHGLAVTIVTVDPHYNTGSTAAFIARASAANPFINFHCLPPVALPPNSSPHHEALAFDLLRLSNPNLLTFLRAATPRALVVDFFCVSALDVAAELCLPCYLFFTSGASVLAASSTSRCCTPPLTRASGSWAATLYWSPGSRRSPPTTCRSPCSTATTTPTTGSSASPPACRISTASSSTRTMPSSRECSRPSLPAAASRTAGRRPRSTPSGL